jgi:hypothetical protein
MQWAAHDLYNNRTRLWLVFRDALDRFAKRLDRDWYFTPMVMEPREPPTAAEPVQQPAASPATPIPPEPEPATVAPPAATAYALADVLAIFDKLTTTGQHFAEEWMANGRSGDTAGVAEVFRAAAHKLTPEQVEIFNNRKPAPAMTVQHGRNKDQFAPVPTTEARL